MTSTRLASPVRYPPSLSLTLLALLAAGTLGAAPPDQAPAVDWPQFRGPTVDGVARPGNLEKGKVGLELSWKRSLGSGYSSISISGDHLVTMFTDGETDFLASFDPADGSERWRYEIAAKYVGHDGSDDGPLSTPAVHRGKVYALGAMGELFALRLADGAEIWRRQLGETEAAAPFYGFTTAPLVAGELLIVETGGGAGKAITALHLADGRTAWTSVEDSVNYQSPTLLSLAGVQQLVVATDHRLIGLDAPSGKELWSLEHSESEEAAGSGYPVALGGDRVLLVIDGEAIAVQVNRHGGHFEAEEIWRSSNIKRNFAVPLLIDGYLYAFNGRFLTCVDPATGSTVWKSRPPGGRGLMAVDGHLVILGNEGDLVLVEASPEGYREAARLPLFDDPGWTAPSFAAGQIYVRNLSEMAGIRITDSPPAALDPLADLDLRGSLGTMLARALQLPASERQSLVDSFLIHHDDGSLIESGGLAHFLYRGAASSLIFGRDSPEALA